VWAYLAGTRNAEKVHTSNVTRYRDAWASASDGRLGGEIDSEAMRTARAYLAGMGATSALVAAAAVAFLSLAALVGFNGLPGGGDESATGDVNVGRSGAAAQAAAAVGAARGAVAATPTPAGATADGEPVPGATGAPAPVGGGSESDLPELPTTPGTPPSVGGEAGAVAPPTAPQPPVGDAVDQVDETGGGLGIDLGLGDAIDPITGPLQDTVG
jgi:hypothetical protein